MGASSKCYSKYALFAINTIIFILGICVVALGGVALNKLKELNFIVQRAVLYLPVAAIVLGVIIMLIAFLGCCGVAKECSSALYCYAVIVFIVLLLEFIMGILIIVLSKKVNKAVSYSMYEVIGQYKGGDINPIVQGIDFVQEKFKCCGVEKYMDWTNEAKDFAEDHPGSVPDSCCKNVTIGCGENVVDTDNEAELIYMEGCLFKIKADIKKAAIGLGAAAISLGLIQVISIVLVYVITSKIS